MWDYIAPFLINVPLFIALFRFVKRRNPFGDLRSILYFAFLVTSILVYQLFLVQKVILPYFGISVKPNQNLMVFLFYAIVLIPSFLKLAAETLHVKEDESIIYGKGPRPKISKLTIGFFIIGALLLVFLITKLDYIYYLTSF